VSVSVANQYLSGFLQQELTTRTPVNRRDFEYTLTKDGTAHLTEQVLRYLREIFVLANSARGEIVLYLRSILQEGGIRRLAVYPAGEVAETILHALDALDMEVVGIVDDDLARQGSSFHGRVVAAPETLADMAIDAVLVATYQHRPAILARLREIGLPRVKVVCL